MSSTITLQKRIFSTESQPPKQSGWYIRILIMVITVSLCTVLFAFHLNKQKKEIIHYNVVVGNVWSKNALKAEFTFPVFKDEYNYIKEIAEAKKSALQVFLINENGEKNAWDFLDNFFKHFKQSEVVINESIRELLKENIVLEFTQLNN
ncbi:MAG: hypothetical protein Q8M94_03685, partial [Ignavibacteria bacterium]|nr:hypothetical protein [Ignavibacteria bacterium]